MICENRDAFITITCRQRTYYYELVFDEHFDELLSTDPL